ncbi:hypothetical protein JCM10450v2_000378 [Rhodotorula kratochvilovae]
MADSPYPSKAPRRKRSHKSGLTLDCSADDAKRVPMACIACRKRKIRCDGHQPACTNCTRNGKSGCRYERVTAEENQEVKTRKRLAKLRKEHCSKSEVEPPSQLATRRRWSRTISFDKDYIPVAPDVTSAGSLPYLSPSPSGLSSATHHLSLEQTQSESSPAFSPGRQGYFDHPGSSYPITPHDEPTEYFVAVHTAPVQTAPSVFAPVSSQASPYPLTPPMEDAYGCSNDPNCTCHYAAAVMQQQQPARRPTFGWSYSAPQVPTMHPYPRTPYEQPQPLYSPALSPTALPEAPIPQPPAYLLSNGDLPAPIPVRTAQQPSFIRVDPPMPAPLAVQPPMYTPYPAVAVQRDAFLSPEVPATWAEAFVEDDIPLDCAGMWTEPWVAVQGKAAPHDEYSGFEQEAW